jgi:hypothetical protein
VCSGCLALFFSHWAASTSTAHTACSPTAGTLDFSKPATDGVATDPCDLNQPRDAATPPLECEQSHEAPPIFFIQSCDNTIDRLMLIGHGAIWMLLASLTNALMDIRLIGLFHSRFARLKT